MTRLKIQQLDIGEGLFKCYEFTLKDMRTGKTIYKDSIDDTRQGIETANKEVISILKRKRYIN
jgi:hypothetical protein